MIRKISEKKFSQPLSNTSRKMKQPTRDGSNPANYRLKVLIGCLCKTMERNGQQKIGLVSRFQQIYRQFSMWIQKAEIYNGSCGQIRNPP